MPECQGCGQDRETIVVEVGATLVQFCLDCVTRLSAARADTVANNLGDETP